MNTKRIDVVCDFNISKLCKRNCNMDCRAYKQNLIRNISGIKLQFNGINFMEKIYKDSDNHLTRKYEMFKLWQTWSPRKGHKFKTFSTKSKKRKLSNDDVIFY